MHKASSGVPYYVIYCDESCHEWTPHDSHRFMTIGGLKVPHYKKTELSHKLKTLKLSCELNSELKWSKVSKKRLKDYKKVIDFFFEQQETSFRAIVVDQSKVQLDKYHFSDSELAFYKFYYEMLVKWLQPGYEYLILLDYKNNRGADRYMKLKECLDNKLQGIAHIKDLTVINSKETPLAQLCDVIVGAVAAANNGTQKGSAKEELAAYIAMQSGLKNLCTSTAPTVGKFNIFKPDLRY